MARILIVDDDELWSVLLVRQLEREGHQASFALSAEEAIAQVDNAEEAYEILLLDHRLGPGMDGIKLLAQLRNTSPESDAILFTGLDDPEIGLRAYEAGAYRYLHKPFKPQELMLIIQSLLHWRKTQYERKWLHILNQVAGELQEAQTVQDVGRVLIDGGIRLGFDRARFYHVQQIDDVPTLFGICQSGANPVCNFDKVSYPLDNTIYSKAAYEKRQPTFFIDRELGPSFLSTLPQAEGRPESLGEWVILPLFQGEACIGLLNMDNCRKPKSIDPQQKNLLRLFAGQAVSALVRAIRFEEEQEERTIHNLAKVILHKMGNPASEEALDRLLLAVHEHFLGEDHDNNFIVALQDKDNGWYRYRLHIENGVRIAPTWQAPTRGGLTGHVMIKKSPLLIPCNAADFRKEKGIDQIGAHPACSWMGVPLLVGEDVVGAMIMENDNRDHAFTERDYRRLQRLAGHLVSVIQAAWLNEQERAYSKLLHRLQLASELIPGFNEDKVWLTALTLCTADYGAGFDRAMLFLTKDKGARLRGHKAIGHLTLEDAEADWEAYKESKGSWDTFINDLLADRITPTPLDTEVQQCVLDITDDKGKADNAFVEAMSRNKIVVLSKEDAPYRLPADFLARFQVADYCLVPVKAGDRTIGIVVLDNIWERDPNRLGVLDILDNLTNQAALLVENLQKSKALEDLISIQNEVLVQSMVRPLKETLLSICRSIQSIAGADLVAIYPIVDNGDELHYDHEHIATVGRYHPTKQYASPEPTTLSKQLLQESKEPLFSEDVSNDARFFFGAKRSDASIFESEGIKSAIAVPIFGLHTQKPRAMLYIDYREFRQFTDFDRHMTRSFTHFIATAIGNWRDAQGLRDKHDARSDELRKLSTVLKSALEVAQDKDIDKAESRIIEALLEVVPSLFEIPIVSAGISLKRWERSEMELEPIEIHEYVYPKGSDVVNKKVPRKLDFGINSRAMSSNTIQNVPDIRKDLDYRPRAKGSKTLSELDVPIALDGQVIGAFNIESPSLNAFTSQHEEMAKRFADVATLTLGNIRRQRNLSTVLNAVRAITAPTDLQDTLRSIASVVRRAVPNLSTLIIWYQNPHDGELMLADSYFGILDEAALKADPPRTDGMVRYAMTLSEPIWVPNAMQNERFASKKFVEMERIRSTAVFPLRAQNETVGVMFFSYRTEHIFTEEEKRLYPILAEVAAASIQDARLLSESQTERKRFKLALDIAETIGAELNQEEVITKILTRLQSDDLFPNTTPAILLYNDDLKTLEFTRSSLEFYKPDNPLHKSLISIPLDRHSLAGSLAVQSQREKRTRLTNVGNVYSDRSYLPVRMKTNSQMSVTLYSEARGLIGVLVLESDKFHAFDSDAENLARNVAGQIRLAVERARQSEDLEFTEALAAASAWSREIAHDISQEILEIRYRAEALRYNGITPEIENSIQKIDEAAERLAGASLPERQQSELIVLDDFLRRQLAQVVHEQDDSIVLDLGGLRCRQAEIETYPFALERIFRHLVRNSRQAMELCRQTEKEIRISTSMIDNGKVEIEYIDNGPGFPAHLRSKVFRTRLVNEQDPQRGVGLLLVRFIVEQLGGSISLAPNRPEQEAGLRFLIRLPNRPPEPIEEVA
jgi:GAF domain-containing protein/DNA-binding response OmpR family regulator